MSGSEREVASTAALSSEAASGTTQIAGFAEALPAELVMKRRREAAVRANSEAAARRAEADARQRLHNAPVEKGGRGGADPVRYGDWEVKGIAIDF